MAVPMRIIFDARYVRTDFHDGISRYSVELGAALSRLAPVRMLISDPAQLAFFPDAVGHIEAPHPESLREVMTASLIERAGGADVVFSPLQTLGSFRRKFKLILTLQDLIYHRHHAAPGNLRGLTRVGWFLYHLTYLPQRLTINRADTISTVSQTSKQEIIAARLTRKRVIVVPNAPRRFNVEDAELRETPPRNLVFMGSLMRYKNPEVLIRGMRELPGRSLHLLSRGTPNRIAELRAQVPDGADVVFHEGVSDEEYVSLLRDDSILVTASLDEGFGLPPAEALSIGVPVVVSDIPVLHEVAGRGAAYFDPSDPSAFAAAVRSLDDRGERERMVALGKSHLAQYTWEASARVLLREMNRLVGG